MKLMFLLAAVTAPVFAAFDNGAAGILISLLFLLLAAFFSKPRFARRKID